MGRHLPNLITSINLFCGCLAVIAALEGNLCESAYLIGVAAILDFFDGFAARVLAVFSEIGKQLDSLADMISFGLAPGMIMWKLFEQSLAPDGMSPVMMPLQYMALLVPVFSAWRLAKFNVDTRQSDSFLGLPTPANAMLLASLPLILAHDRYGLDVLILNPWFLSGLTLLTSFLMVSEVPLMSLKFKTYGWNKNRMRYILMLSTVILMPVFLYAAIPMVIVLYIVLSIAENIIKHEVHGRN